MYTSFIGNKGLIMNFIPIKEAKPKDRVVLKAQLAWAALVNVALKEEKLTYQELGNIINHPYRRLMPIITYIGRFCSIHELPYLPVLCVRKDTGWPGGGFQNPKEDTMAVYAFPWEEYPLPSIEQFRKAYDDYALKKELKWLGETP